LIKSLIFFLAKRKDKGFFPFSISYMMIFQCIATADKGTDLPVETIQRMEQEAAGMR